MKTTRLASEYNFANVRVNITANKYNSLQLQMEGGIFSGTVSEVNTKQF